MTVTRLGNLLDADPAQPLGKVVRHARHMDDLAARLRAALPAAEAENLLAANLHDDGALVLICSSSSWAARLRFESDRLMAAAREAGLAVERLRVRVAAG